MWRGIIAAAAAALLLAAAASPADAHGGAYIYVPIYTYVAPPVLPDAKTGGYSQIHTVAIIVAVAQSMTLGRAGWLTDHKSIDISDLKLDDFVDGAMRTYIGNHFKIVDVPYDRAGLFAIPNGTEEVSTGDLKKYLLALNAPGVDAFIVVRPDGEGGANTPGLSLSGGRMYSSPLLYANFEIDVVKAGTGEIIAHALSRIQPRQGAKPDFADIFGPVQLNIAPNDTPTPEQRAGLKIVYQRLLTDAIIETLRPLNLGIALPQPGARVLAPIPDNLRPKIKNVAVVSAIGDAVTLDHRGAFFVHDVSTAPITDWNIDNEVEADVTAALDKHFTVKQIPADRAKIEKQSFAVDDAIGKTPIDGLTPSNDIDAYIVVVKTSGHFGPMPGELDPGLSVSYWTPVGDEKTALYASYAIVIVEPKTLVPVHIQRAITSPAKPVATIRSDVDNSDWPSDGKTLTPAQAAAIHPVFSGMLSDSLDETLMSLRLTPLYPTDDLPSADGSASAQTAAQQAKPE